MEMGEVGDVGRRTGMFMSILALGALAGPPISGAINTATGSFKPVGYYAGTQTPVSATIRLTVIDVRIGTAVLLGVGLISVSRYFVIRRMWGKI